MQRSLLSRLRTNGASYLISGLILLLVIPLYQSLILGPTGFSHALAETGTGRYTTYLTWISTHISPFLIYRGLLLLAFLLLLTFPFSLYRIIVAQELMGQQEREVEEQTQHQRSDAQGNVEEDGTLDEERNDVGSTQEIIMPDYAWRGKGFAVLAAWLGLIGFIIYLIGEASSTAYYLFVAGSTGAAIQNSVASFSPLFIIVTNTIGIGMIGLSSLFFGAMILRTGRNLWPGSWVILSYMMIFTGAILCISGVAVASTPGNGQSTLTTIATLLFAIEMIWTGIILVRLKPEV